MAAESKPMDIEEEVPKIEDEVKKPEDEGQVAERELNYQRKPRAENLKAPDVFRGMRGQVLPVLQAYDTPTGLPDNPKDKKVLPLKDPIPKKGTLERHVLDNPDTKHLDMFKSELIKFMHKLKKVGGATEMQEKLNERGTQRGGKGSGVASQRTRNRNEKLQYEKLHRYDEIPKPKERKPMTAEALERRRLNFEKPRTRRHTDLTRRKYRNQSFTNSLLELNEKLKRGGESIGSDSKPSGKAPFHAGSSSTDKKINRLSAGDQTKKPKIDAQGNLIPNRSTTGSTGKKDKPVDNTANYRKNRKTGVGGAMGKLRARQTKPEVVAVGYNRGSGGLPTKRTGSEQTRRGQQRSAKRGIKLLVTNRSQDDFESSDDPVGAGHGRKMPELGADLSDKKISTNKPSMPTKKPAKRTGLGTSGLGSGVGSPITRANNREWFSEVYGI